MSRESTVIAYFERTKFGTIFGVGDTAIYTAHFDPLNVSSYALDLEPAGEKGQAMTKQAPCPFCGKSRTLVWHTKAGIHTVTCADCNAEGPTAKTEDEAIRRWNTRADQARDADD